MSQQNQKTVIKPYRELHRLSQRGMTLQDIEKTLKRTSHNGFPITISKDIPYLIGFVLRRDLCLAIDHLKMTHPLITERTTVDFNQRSPENWKDVRSINLGRIVDMAPLTVTVQTPMETVIEMFCKLGLRQLLVTEHGREERVPPEFRGLAKLSLDNGKSAASQVEVDCWVSSQRKMFLIIYRKLKKRKDQE
ncbi:hypothetical protein CEXT_187901 [Caerostris extrusa]|uniref:CBS domain-containing protein n=1 Tax=Caerostris extrusa TaxID=172846 RepID=A0AAV4MLW6_CAEEX|nr:hypothetical protein CEXT_187901 [Caerostris extrusa]